MNRRALLLGGSAVAASGTAWGIMRQRTERSEYAAAIARQRAPLPQDAGWQDIIRFATLAANGHNTQPWQFRLRAHGVEILPDFSRRTPIVDPDDHHLYASLGCATENLLLAAHGAGMPGEAQFEPQNDGRIIIATSRGATHRPPLLDAIPLRQSVRAEFDGSDIPVPTLAAVERAGQIPGVQVSVITGPQKMERLADLIIAGNTQQMGDAAFVAELKRWMRFNPGSALRSGDGLYAPASGSPSLPTWIAAPLFDLLFRVNAENDKYARQMKSTAAAIVISGDRADREHWLLAGRACQRAALQATALGVKSSFVNQPVEVPALREDLAALAGVPGKRPDIVLRLGRGPDLPMSPRRTAEAVIVA